MAYAGRPLMRRGCYCSVSLRTCLITLACFNLTISCCSIVFSSLIAYQVTFHAAEAFQEDFTHDESSESSTHNDATTTSTPELDAGLSTGNASAEDIFTFEEDGGDPSHEMVVAILFDGVNFILQCVSVVVLIILLVGAVKKRTGCIRPWLLVGAVFIFFDLVYIIVHTAIGFHFLFYCLPSLSMIPLNSYQWVVAYSMYQECRETERRNQSLPLSMSALEENQQEDVCTVPYETLSPKA